MPNAIHFSTDGAENGFPSCRPKVDVSVYDHWTTLSGWSKVNEPSSDEDKAASIAESLTLAMSFYWNASSLRCNATTSGTSSRDGTISTVSVNYEVLDYDVPFPDPPILIDSGPAEPRLRTCIPSSFDNIVKSYDFYESDGSANAKIATIGVVAMYDGVAFVGYGLSFVETRFQSGGTIEAEAGGASSLNAGVFAGGYGYTPANTTNDAFDFGYVTLDGLSLFAYVEAKNGPSLNVSGSVNLSSLSASCTLTSTSPPSVATADASITSLDFYTYP